ncbi:hypothetical protein JG687_00004529 [Phytophthora cactorum]|uniref:Uncharacterized protein n=1 Tax=Phytophthora cactorum TaxID=29920 RepID=A0A8T1UT01_9STRA|nr:hypothetical protein PC121_g8987 [Phytophthora cactorum]KAG4045125.1 hypothetical protein PC123_g19462 [Phytophthora cactorum]KAG6966985.1 hypothetical protein JG687_00004529 [Phytophthora cactorum]
MAPVDPRAAAANARGADTCSTALKACAAANGSAPSSDSSYAAYGSTVVDTSTSSSDVGPTDIATVSVRPTTASAVADLGATAEYEAIATFDVAARYGAFAEYGTTAKCGVFTRLHVATRIGATSGASASFGSDAKPRSSVVWSPGQASEPSCDRSYATLPEAAVSWATCAPGGRNGPRVLGSK